MAYTDEHSDTETMELEYGPAGVRPSARPTPACDTPTTGEGTIMPSAMRDCGVIGRGGMGIVHQVYEPALDRMVATKVIRPEKLATRLSEFLQEARVLARLEHPGIVPLHQLGRNGEGQIDRFSMKLVRGKSLAQFLTERARVQLDPDALALFLRRLLQVCDALSFAHSRGVIHRDLKPDNIMFGRFGEVYVMDWGIAIDRSQPPRLSSRLLGTPAYMAPEQFEGVDDRIDERTDVFGLGAILYEVLTGRPPHAGDTVEDTLVRARRCQPTPPELVVPETPVPAALSDIVMRALRSDPAERHQTVSEFKREVQRFLDSGAWALRCHYAAGTVIVEQGEPGDMACLIERGRCGVYAEEGGQHRLLRELGAGDSFGEIALFTGQPRTASVSALSDVTLLRISGETFERVAPAGSWLRSFVTSLADRFMEYDTAHRDLPRAAGTRDKP